jgi:hypothetical protein
MVGQSPVRNVEAPGPGVVAIGGRHGIPVSVVMMRYFAIGGRHGIPVRHRRRWLFKIVLMVLLLLLLQNMHDLNPTIDRFLVHKSAPHASLE